jgi:hypothetical protein
MIEGSGFLDVVWFGSSPTASHSSISKLDQRHIGLDREREITYGRERGKGVGKEPNHTTARKPGTLLHK